MLLDHGENDGLMLLETANRAGFICTHEGAVSSDVGRKYCRQPARNLGLAWPFGHLPVARANTRGNISTLPDEGSTACKPNPRAVLGTDGSSELPCRLSDIEA